jgi:hypothetical protein
MFTWQYSLWLAVYLVLLVVVFLVEVLFGVASAVSKTANMMEFSG